MILISGLVFFLMVPTAEGRVGDSSKSELCTETRQCLLHDLICESEDYEVRHYGSVKWVSTDERYFFMEVPAFKAFGRLFEYITGGNEKNQSIEMTSPVLIKVKKGGFLRMNVYTMSFLLPAEHQMTPPKPTDNKVYIHAMPDMKVYVQSYGEFMMTYTDRMHAKSLASQLDKIGAQYNKDFHFAVGYNSPMTLTDRHNEVWYVAEGKPVCPASDNPEPTSS